MTVKAPRGLTPRQAPLRPRAVVEVLARGLHELRGRRGPLFALLERHGAAYVVRSGAHLPCVLRATSPLVHVRWHGAGHRVLGYFNNDGHGHAVHDVRRLRARLGV